MLRDHIQNRKIKSIDKIDNNVKNVGGDVKDVV